LRACGVTEFSGAFQGFDPVGTRRHGSRRREGFVGLGFDVMGSLRLGSRVHRRSMPTRQDHLNAIRSVSGSSDRLELALRRRVRSRSISASSVQIPCDRLRCVGPAGRAGIADRGNHRVGVRREAMIGNRACSFLCIRREHDTLSHR
jgi:hypothetical protein